MTPLHYAAGSGHSDVVSLLADNESNIYMEQRGVSCCYMIVAQFLITMLMMLK